MSWYFLGGFSAYCTLPSGRQRNHCGCCATHGCSGAHWKAMSMAISRPWAAESAIRASKSSSVPRSGRMSVCPPSLRPRPSRSRVRRDRRSGSCFSPCGSCARSDEWAAKYRTSKPSSWMRGSSFCTSLNVPCCPAIA